MSRVLVICAEKYNGHELWTLLGVLQERGHTFEVVSKDTLIMDEATLQYNTIGRTFYDIPHKEAHEFNGIVVVSGNMKDTEFLWTHEPVQDLLKAFRAAGCTIGGICGGVPTLAPLCQGVKVSYFPLVRSRHRLEKFGAILQKVSLTVDQGIITAENQLVSQMWATEICNALEGKPQEFELTETKFMPTGGPRRMPKAVEEAIAEAQSKNKK